MSWDGLKQFDEWVANQSTATDNAVKEGIAKAQAMVIKESQANFSGTHKAGQPHVGPNGGYPNVPSPGGNLKRSIIPQPIVRYGLADYGTSVGPTAVYSRAIELGLWQNPSIKYPFFSPGVKRASAQFPEMWNATFMKYLK